MIGTSLEVAPVRFVPEEAHLIPGLKKAMINLDETPYDHLFDIVINQKSPSLFGNSIIKGRRSRPERLFDLHHSFYNKNGCIEPAVCRFRVFRNASGFGKAERSVKEVGGSFSLVSSTRRDLPSCFALSIAFALTIWRRPAA